MHIFRMFIWVGYFEENVDLLCVVMQITCIMYMKYAKVKRVFGARKSLKT